MDDLMLAALALSAVSGLVYWAAFAGANGTGWFRTTLRTWTLAPLAALFMVDSLQYGTGDLALSLGLCLAVLGDFLLSRPGEKAAATGLLAVGLGHLAYALAMLTRSGQLGFDGINLPEAMAFAGLGLALLAAEGGLIPSAGRRTGALRALVLISGLVAAAALLLPSHPGQSWMRAGVALVLVSDMLLLCRLLQGAAGPKSRALGVMQWPCHVVGQVLVAIGAFVLWMPPKG